MHVESVMFVGWMAVPAVAYAGGRALIWWSSRHHVDRTAVDSAQRLAEIRRHPEGGSASRGRMAEAMRLAEGPAGRSVSTTRF